MHQAMNNGKTPNPTRINISTSCIRKASNFPKSFSEEFKSLWGLFKSLKAFPNKLHNVMNFNRFSIAINLQFCTHATRQQLQIEVEIEFGPCTDIPHSICSWWTFELSNFSFAFREIFVCFSRTLLFALYCIMFKDCLAVAWTNILRPNSVFGMSKH